MTTDDVKTADKVRAARTAKPAATGIETAKEQFAKVAETQFKAVDEVAAFSKSTMDAFLQSGSIFFHGLEAMARTIVGATQAQVETSMSVAKSLITAKTLAELTDLQNSYAKSTFDTAVNDATKISELAIKVTTEALEPINARVTATIEQLSKPMTV